MLTIRKKIFFLTCLFGNSVFLKNSKIKNFDLSVVEVIEECIKNIHTKFQINRFIRTWDIVYTNSKVFVVRVSTSTLLEGWLKTNLK